MLSVAGDGAVLVACSAAAAAVAMAAVIRIVTAIGSMCGAGSSHRHVPPCALRGGIAPRS
jgi:hypothetical protein